MNFQLNDPTLTYQEWVDSTILKKKNFVYLIIASAILFAALKIVYPFASFIYGDSFSYIEAAEKNLSINIYLTGYSMILRFFSIFSYTDTFVVTFQFFILLISNFILWTTLCFIFSRTPNFQKAGLWVLTLNPLYFYISNMISSDSIFLSLSLLWLATLLQMINKQGKKLIIFHALILFLAFTVRYNALSYMLISVLAFFLSSFPNKLKTIGILCALAPIGLFVANTEYHYKKQTGISQYSPFGGWLMANNAMYAYRYVDSARREPVDKKFFTLDKMVREFFDSTRDTKKYPAEKLMASTVYMWSPGLTLYKYRNSLFAGDTTSSEFKKWATMGPFYFDYGRYIIKKYPLYFAKYFVWPNTVKYYAPPLEFLTMYNCGKKFVTPEAEKWFNYGSNAVFTRCKWLQQLLLTPYTIISGVANLMVLLMSIFFMYLEGIKRRTVPQKAFLIVFSFWLTNAFFTIFSSSAALRFQSFPFTLALMFDLILLSHIWALAYEKSTMPAYEKNSRLLHT